MNTFGWIKIRCVSLPECDLVSSEDASQSAPFHLPHTQESGGLARILKSWKRQHLVHKYRQMVSKSYLCERNSIADSRTNLSLEVLQADFRWYLHLADTDQIGRVRISLIRGVILRHLLLGVAVFCVVHVCCYGNGMPIQPYGELEKPLIGEKKKKWLKMTIQTCRLL